MISKVNEVMSREVKTISDQMNARDALKALVTTGMSGLPVVDNKGDLVGVFTEKEVLKAILPAYVKDVGSFVYGADSKMEIRKIQELERFLVRDLMRMEVPAVDEDTTLTEASKIMLTKSERRIVVVKGRKPVGIITRCDVVRALAKKAGVTL